jgi:hypothetical protein
MQVETVSTREVASTCAIEVAIGLGWLMDQVDGMKGMWQARHTGGLGMHESAGNHMKRVALTYGWLHSLF